MSLSDGSQRRLMVVILAWATSSTTKMAQAATSSTIITAASSVGEIEVGVATPIKLTGDVKVGDLVKWVPVNPGTCPSTAILDEFVDPEHPANANTATSTTFTFDAAGDFFLCYTSASERAGDPASVKQDGIFVTVKEASINCKQWGTNGGGARWGCTDDAKPVNRGEDKACKGASCSRATCCKALDYVGCYENDHGDRVKAVENEEDMTVIECVKYARGKKMGYLGMEYPQGADVEGEAQCHVFEDVPEMNIKRDSDCEKEVFDGYRLGSSKRVAVYSLEAHSSDKSGECACKNGGCKERSFLSGDGGFEKDCKKHKAEDKCCGQRNLNDARFCKWVLTGGSGDIGDKGGCSAFGLINEAHNSGVLLGLFVAGITALGRI